MTDWTKEEENFIWEGIRCGGEYLDSLGKSDLAVLTKDELIEFGKCLLGRVTEQRQINRDEFNDDIPF